MPELCILFADCRKEIAEIELGKQLTVLAVYISLDLVILKGEGRNLLKASGIL